MPSTDIALWTLVVLAILGVGIIFWRVRLPSVTLPVPTPDPVPPLPSPPAPKESDVPEPDAQNDDEDLAGYAEEMKFLADDARDLRRRLGVALRVQRNDRMEARVERIETGSSYYSSRASRGEDGPRERTGRPARPAARAVGQADRHKRRMADPDLQARLLRDRPDDTDPEERTARAAGHGDHRANRNKNPRYSTDPTIQAWYNEEYDRPLGAGGGATAAPDTGHAGNI